MSQFLQPDFSRGDPDTLGGYMAVHDRPAAFEGSDGFSYSVEILVDDDPGSPGGRWSGYLFFVKWARIGASAPEGHLESDTLARGETDSEVRASIGALALSEVKRELDRLIARVAGGAPRRRWWDAMRDDDSGAQGSP